MNLRQKIIMLRNLADRRAVSRLRNRSIGSERAVNGRIAILGWDLEYVDGLALASSLEVLVLKGWNDFVPENDRPLILDCGANIGISVLNYKRKIPGARIIAFEPDPHVLPILRRNLERNGMCDVEIVPAAVWTCRGEGRLFTEGIDGSRIVATEDMYRPIVTVPTVNLADYLAEPVDLLKMDIEGGEFEVLPAMGERLLFVRNLVVECHIGNEDVRPFANLLQILASAGFIVAVNSLGQWRDLVRRPPKLTNEFDQYLLLAAWRCGDYPRSYGTRHDINDI